MGADHVRTLTRWVPAARVVAVYDFDGSRATEVAAEAGAQAITSVDDFFRPSRMDALIIASPDATHTPLALEAISAGIPILCEKPLGVTPQESRSVVEAETATGRRLVTVGFMRRFDPGYAALRQGISSGDIGTVRVMHNIHRNKVGHPASTTEGVITNAMVHEFDIVPWLTGSPIVSIEVRSPSPAEAPLRDPQLAIVELLDGTLVTIEVCLFGGYGYDIQCEVLGATGTLSLRNPAFLDYVRSGATGTAIPEDFRQRFAEAYRLELSAWTMSVLSGQPIGPTAWDAHLAAAVAEAGVESLRSGIRIDIDSKETPALYR